jgi:hypothetical protein
MTRCPWKIRWTYGQDAQCEKKDHLELVEIIPQPGGQFSVATAGVSPEHEAQVGPHRATRLHWEAGDRREFTGDWPGPCVNLVAGCTLHAGHHGRCAP